MEQLKALAEPLAGKRVLHLSATAFGGGVAEILYTLVPLMRDAGLDTSGGSSTARTSSSTSRRRSTTRLQGAPRSLSDEEKEIFRRYNLGNAEALTDSFDYVIVHDPQPAGDDRPRSRLRPPLDLALPHRPLDAERGRPRLPPPVASLLRLDGVPPRGVRAAPRRPAARVHLAAGDRPADAEEHGALSRGRVLHRRPVRDRRRPPARHPGVPVRPVEGPARRHRSVPRPSGEPPATQLALVGSMAHDDPEGWDYYNQTVAAAGGDPDIFILSNLNNVGSVEVNAFQVHSEALVQKSIKEGFGLTVTEALWKARPIVAGRAGGIVDQIQDGETGFLVGSSRSVRRRCSRSSTIRRKRARWRFAARSTCDGTSSRPGFCGLARAFQPPRRKRSRRRRARDRIDDGLVRIAAGRVSPWRVGASSSSLPTGLPSRFHVKRRHAHARRGGGGLVTALRSLITHQDVTWVASAMSAEDHVVAAEAGSEPVEEAAGDGSPYRLRLVSHDPQAYDLYYNVVSNPVSGSRSTTSGVSSRRRTSTTGSTSRGRRAIWPSTTPSRTRSSRSSRASRMRTSSSTTTTSTSRRGSCGSACRTRR